MVRVFRHEIKVGSLALAEVWERLARLLETPSLYTPGCGAVSVRRVADCVLEREKNFSGILVRDRVEMRPRTAVRVTVEAGESWPGSVQTIELLGADGSASLRFTYEQDIDGLPEETPYSALRNEAYRNVDKALADMIRKTGA